MKYWRRSFPKGSRSDNRPFEGTKALTAEERESLINELAGQEMVAKVNLNGIADEGRVLNFNVVLDQNPYSVEAINAVEKMINDAEKMVKNSGVEGTLYFAGKPPNSSMTGK